MSQSRRMSLVESCVNTLGGFAVALGCQVTIFPWFDIHISVASSAGIAILMMVQSLARQYAFRRLFVWLEGRKGGMVPAPTPEGLYETLIEAGGTYVPVKVVGGERFERSTPAM